jgi:hypothetical protein
MTGKKTSVSLRAKVARGEPVGRPRTTPQDTLDAIRLLLNEGLSYAKVAESLNAEGITGSQGAPWAKQSVYETVKRYGIKAQPMTQKELVKYIDEYECSCGQDVCPMSAVAPMIYNKGGK